jgi:dolichol-phosphate mannosyltransferase
MAIRRTINLKLAIAIPTYNEALNLSILLPAIKKVLESNKNLWTTVFIIDDSSPDKTAAVAEKLGRKLKSKTFSIKVINKAKKEGLGAAYIYGFQEILKQDFDFIMQMDADMSHDPIYIPQLIDASKTADLVIGSRYAKGASVLNCTLKRKILSRGGNIYTRLFLGNKVTDYTNGFNLYSTKLLKSLDLDTIDAPGYGFLIQLKYRALKKCHGVKEVPIIFNNRKLGESKIPKNTLIKNLILVPQLRLSIK